MLDFFPLVSSFAAFVCKWSVVPKMSCISICSLYGVLLQLWLYFLCAVSIRNELRVQSYIFTWRVFKLHNMQTQQKGSKVKALFVGKTIWPRYVAWLTERVHLISASVDKLVWWQGPKACMLCKGQVSSARPALKWLALMLHSRASDHWKP